MKLGARGLLALLLLGACGATRCEVALDPEFGSGGVAGTFPGFPDAGVGVAVDAAGRILLGGYRNFSGDYAVARLRPDGSLDPDFGSGGVAGTFPGDFGAGVGVTVDAAGRVLLGGWRSGSGDYAVARLRPDGSLDPDFGSGGVAGTFVGPFLFRGGVGLAVDAAGRILLGGWREGSGDYAVARLRPDGSLDSDFGSGGVAGTFPGSGEAGVGVTVDAAGRVLLGGWRSSSSDYAVARLRPDGSLDPDFGSGGVAGTFQGLFVGGVGVTVDAAGRILLGGWREGSGDYAVARLRPDGSLDPDFGSGGMAGTFPGSGEAGVGVTVDAAGRILLGGVRGGSGDYAVARLRPDGSLDPDFGSGGVAGTFPGDFGAGVGVTVDAAGRILLGGYRGGTGDYGVARLTGPFAVAGRVWLDRNADGRRDGAEPGVPDTWVLLLDAANDELLDITASEPDGSFALGFPSARRFRLEFLPEPFGPTIFTRYRVSGAPAFDGDSDALQNGRTLATAPSIGATREDLSAGLLPDHLIGDRAWIDLNGNGVQDPGEPGLAGVTFELLDGHSGMLLASATTSPEGWYAFPDVAAGSYRLRVLATPGFVLTLPGQGGSSTLDSDFDPATGLSPVFAYNGGYAMGFDAGFVPTGFIFGDGFEGD